MFPLKDRYKKYPNYLRSCIEFMLAMPNSLFNFLTNYRIHQENIYKIFVMFLIPQFSWVVQSCLTLQPHGLQHARLPCLHQLLELVQLLSIQSVMPSIHLILCCPLLLLPSIFRSIRVFASESVLHIRWPKYWGFSFSIGPPNEYLVLISFRIDWLISL